jgi:hypothetical protein
MSVISTNIHIKEDRAQVVGGFLHFQGNPKTYRPVKHDTEGTPGR